jgi:hypothetical protein
MQWGIHGPESMTPLILGNAMCSLPRGGPTAANIQKIVKATTHRRHRCHYAPTTKAAAKGSRMTSSSAAQLLDSVFNTVQPC